MPDKQPTPEAMRTAKAIMQLASGRSGRFLLGVMEDELALIIDREMKPKWIKCSDRMPKENKNYLTYEKGEDPEMQILIVSNGMVFDQFGDCIVDKITFTHYQNLPDDPEPEDATK